VKKCPCNVVITVSISQDSREGVLVLLADNASDIVLT
jgi:hypothetical protein